MKIGGQKMVDAATIVKQALEQEDYDVEGYELTSNILFATVRVGNDRCNFSFFRGEKGWGWRKHEDEPLNELMQKLKEHPKLRLLFVVN
jgi:ABC-type proline/glycine betaine transport system substrate-binding protein